MALSLEKLRSRSQNDTKGKSSSKKASKNKANVLRPWQSYDERESTTRTIKAHEAVLKAKKITEKNEELTESIKKRKGRNESPDELVQTEDARLLGSDYPSSFWGDYKRPPGIVSFIKYLFNL